MGVFKNDVGRPTNETIKKRRILKAILALLVAGALFTGGYYVNEFINKYDVNKEKENDISSKLILTETMDEEANAEFTYNKKKYSLSVKAKEESVLVLLNDKKIHEVFAPVGLGNIYLLDDILVIHIYSGDVRGQSLVFIDFEGNVVKEIGNVIEGNLVLNIGTRDDNISIKNDTITLNMTARTHGETLVYKDNNDIEDSMPYSESVKTKYNITDDTIIDATYEFKYLGNKKFSEMKITDKTTYKEYIETEDLNVGESNTTDNFDKSKLTTKKVYDNNYGDYVIEVYYEDKKLDFGIEPDFPILSVNNISSVENIIVFNVYFGTDGVILTIIDNKGNIIGKYDGKAIVGNYAKRLSGDMYRGSYEIKDNKIYITSDNLGHDPEYSACKLKENDVAEYVEEIIYSNNKLTTTKIHKETTAKEIILKNNFNCEKIK